MTRMAERVSRDVEHAVDRLAWSVDRQRANPLRAELLERVEHERREGARVVVFRVENRTAHE